MQKEKWNLEDIEYVPGYVIIYVLYVAHVRGQKNPSAPIKQILKNLFLTCLMLKM